MAVVLDHDGPASTRPAGPRDVSLGTVGSDEIEPDADRPAGSLADDRGESALTEDSEVVREWLRRARPGIPALRRAGMPGTAECPDRPLEHGDLLAVPARVEVEVPRVAGDRPDVGFLAGVLADLAA